MGNGPLVFPLRLPDKEGHVLLIDKVKVCQKEALQAHEASHNICAILYPAAYPILLKTKQQVVVKVA